MNSKKLMIAFVAVSIAALIVSSVAVFAVARTYSAALARDNGSPAEDIAPPEISASIPAESTPVEAPGEPLTEDEETSVIPEMTDEVTSAAETTGSTTAAVTEAVAFTLTLSAGRLVILSPEGEAVYERIIDPSDLHPKDREALSSGIDFPDLAGAMSAVYDLIS